MAGTTVAVTGCSFTDNSALKHLARMTKLQTLSLSRTAVSDDGLKELAGLTDLRTLWLSGAKVKGPGL